MGRETFPQFWDGLVDAQGGSGKVEGHSRLSGMGRGTLPNVRGVSGDSWRGP